MRFVAILKDSFREAVDSKVFYVMVALSAALTLFVGTMSFRPRPVEEFFRAVEQADHAAPWHYNVRQATPRGGAADDPGSEFEITVRVWLSDPAEAALVRQDPGPFLEQVRDRFGVMDGRRLLEVSEVRLVEPAALSPPAAEIGNAVYCAVTARPTGSALLFWPHEVSLFLGAVPLAGIFRQIDKEAEAPPLGMQLWFIEDQLVSGLGAWVAVLVSVIVTGFFIPGMLRKGTVDLLLVKPMRRWTLLVYKYVGGLTFIFLNTTMAVGGVWLALGFRSHIWASGFLSLIPIITFFFAILYAVSTLFAVWSRSAVVAILMTLLAWAFFYSLGFAFSLVQQEKVIEPRAVAAIRALHFALPRVKDLDFLTTRLLSQDLLTEEQYREVAKLYPMDWGESVLVDVLFIAVLLGLACWRFATRDY